MGQRLRLGVVGCGDIAGYVAGFSRLVRPIRLAACCDVDAGRAAAFARRFRIPAVFTDYAALLASGSIDAVYLAVPHHLHLPMLRQALAAGLPVLMEKPLTRTLEEARQIAAEIEQGGVKVGVNYQYRYDAGCYALRAAVQAGELGAVHSVRINVPWRREAGYFAGAAWHRHIATAGGGTLLTQGSHFLDAALWALDDPPASAVGYTARPGFDVEVETLAHGIVATRGGVLVQIASTMAAAREQPATMEVYGDRATAYYRAGLVPRLRFSGAAVPAGPRLPVGGLHALQRSLAGFAAWLLEDRPYLTPACAAVPVLAAVEAIYRSSQSGQRELVESTDEPASRPT